MPAILPAINPRRLDLSPFTESLVSAVCAACLFSMAMPAPAAEVPARPTVQTLDAVAERKTTPEVIANAREGHQLQLFVALDGSDIVEREARAHMLVDQRAALEKKLREHLGLATPEGEAAAELERLRAHDAINDQSARAYERLRDEVFAKRAFPTLRIVKAYTGFGLMLVELNDFESLCALLRHPKVVLVSRPRVAHQT